jgi:hypothetical protein
LTYLILFQELYIRRPKTAMRNESYQEAQLCVKTSTKGHEKYILTMIISLTPYKYEAVINLYPIAY